MIKISDFYLACFLELKLKKICTFERINNDKVYFIFDHEDFNKYVDEYYNNAQVNVIDFKNKIKDLKSRINVNV